MRGNAQARYRMDQMAAPQPKELSGWKAIASRLGVGVRTAQDYEKNLGLPVHRQPGEKGRVFADPAELDAWRMQTSSNGSPVRYEDAAADTRARAPVRKIRLRDRKSTRLNSSHLGFSHAVLWLKQRPRAPAPDRRWHPRPPRQGPPS